MGPERKGMDLHATLGGHIRRARKQKGLSLLDVQALSNGEFKASVLGAYERGERAISAARLSGLAELYRLPLQAMFPRSGAAGEGATSVAIDPDRADQVSSPEGMTIARFVRRVQALRQDPGGGAVRIRAGDVVALACALDRTPKELVKLLDEHGLRAF